MRTGIINISIELIFGKRRVRFSKVDDLDLILIGVTVGVVNQKISRFYITVNNPRLMKSKDGLDNLL